MWNKFSSLSFNCIVLHNSTSRKQTQFITFKDIFEIMVDDILKNNFLLENVIK